MSAIKIALTNLGQYNEGILNFTWLELPATDEEIAKAFDAIQVSHDDVQYFSDGRGHVVDEDDPEMCGEYEEFFITDYECDFMEIGEYSNLEELNEIAETLDGLTDCEAAIVEALMSECSMDLSEALDNMDDVIVYSGCSDMTDVAYQYVDECDLLHGVPDSLINYFDYEALGRDLQYDGQWFEVGGDMAVLYY